MSLDRRSTEDLLEAYALDVLDSETAAQVEEALIDHTDLRDRVVELRATITALGHHVAERPPRHLQDRVLDAALRVRTPGREISTPAASSQPAAYRGTCLVLRDLLASLGPTDWEAVTVYGIEVAELVSHLTAMEQYTGEQFGQWSSGLDTTNGHIALRPTDPMATPAREAERWWHTAALVAAHADSLAPAELDTTVQMHGSDFPIGLLLIVRSFEVWSHMEDIARATNFAIPALAPSVLHTMAEHATEALVAAIATVDRHRDKTVRITLTGPGGGSWAYAVDGRPLGVDAATDATLVTDVVDYCRLFADRIDPAQLDGDRRGDAELVDDLIRTATAFADFGDPTRP